MADETPEFIWVRESGGIPVKMDLPLPEAIAGRLTTGQLVQVTEGGDLIEAHVKPVRPATSAPKSTWVGYLVKAHGFRVDDAEAMTKQDIIDRVNQLESVDDAEVMTQQDQLES